MNRCEVLLVEDDEADAALVRAVLKRRSAFDFDVTHVDRLDRALRELSTIRFGSVVLDLDLPDSSGLDSIDEVTRAQPRTPVVALGGPTGPPRSQALLHGAADFVTKNELVTLELGRRLSHVVDKARERSRFQRALQDHVDPFVVVTLNPPRVAFTNTAAGELFAAAGRSLHHEPVDLPLTGRPTDYELLLLDGTTRTYAVRTSPIAWQGKAAHLVSLRDITQRKRLAALERRLSTTAHLTHLGRMAESFAETGPSRLLRDNYLTFHDQLSELHANLQREWARSVEVFAKTQALVDEARALTDPTRRDLIESVRPQNLGAPSAVRTGVERRPIDESVREALAHMKSALKTRAGLTLVHRLDALPPSRADHQDITQAVVHLVQNAVDAVDERGNSRGTVRVSAELQGDDHGAMTVHLTVEDSGAGIPAEDRARVFSPFYTTKAVGRGTGLGLPFVADVVAEHHGSIHVAKSELGGAAIRIELPLGGAELDDDPEGKTKPVRRRVLFIHEDPRASEPHDLGAGYDVIRVTDGRDVRRHLFDDDAFDLVVCDLAMVHTDGLEIYEYLCEQDSPLADRIIYLLREPLSPRLRDFADLVPAPVLATPLRRGTLREAAEERLTAGPPMFFSDQPGPIIR
ncbi:MAG: ATP-binding protein [Myxococcota bacterium]